MDSFYTAQSITNELPDANLFIDERTEQKALALLERREARIGSFMERKRIGINRRVMLDGQGRSVIVVCIFEVRCSQGHSIEIVTVTQKNRTEGFFISDFTIEGMEAPMPSQKTRTSSA
ncbi:MAG: hypothetical protein MI717_07665 [Spirochaetales bacterium]|nr:hypothetical protein [Spirochaetales bacterium]